MTDERTSAPPPGQSEAAIFQRDLYLYWRELRASWGFPLTTRGFIARPALRRVRALLGRLGPASADGTALGSMDADLAEGEDPRLLYLRRLLERLRLASVEAGGAREGTRLVAGEPEEMAAYLAHSLAERLRICARLWVAGGWWPDARGAADPLPPLLAPAPPRIALARRRFFELLGTRAVGTELAVPPAARVPSPAGAKRAQLLGRRRTTGRSDSSTQYGDADGELLRAALLGPLAWMGFVVAVAIVPAAMENAPDVQRCLVGLPLAALSPEADAAGLVEPVGRMVLQADASVVAYPPLCAPLLLTLDTCAECVALDVVARYRLTRQAAAHARASGWNAQDIVSRLEALSGASLPANVATTLADWERQDERLRLTPAVTVLEVRDPTVLDRLLSDRIARGWVQRRLTPTAALLDPAHAPSARAWLLRHGEIPAWEHASPPDASPSPRLRAP
ncbi:MAG TPA: helicase-associated domain-containing protein [Ktedonobacterales bacterium]